jgi:cellobiose phosphorylase
VDCTGDRAVLEEPVHFIEGRALNAGEESYYDQPGRSLATASLYQHCVRAITHGLRFGAHGLPLMGSGDWNDGMNLVGIQMKGESVWLGFFLHAVLRAFGELAMRQDDAAFAACCRYEADQLRHNLESQAWDGAWYRRAWFDDGTPLGSAANDECSIDSIAQSWSVLSGATSVERSRMAMEAVDRRLVRRDHQLVCLLDPPFDRSSLNPGYIKGYVPGVRENGGQYTQAAVWAAMAFAALGDGQRAWELLAMINPITHTQDAAAVATYKAEPYVLAADVYAVAPHTGRGGWTWYTGSAGWMYRLAVESLLGLRREADVLHVDPCLPADWPGCSIDYRFGTSIYRIILRQFLDADGPARRQVVREGVDQGELGIALIDDGHTHEISVSIHRNR